MVRGFLKESDAQRFWAKVDKTGECWLWTGYVGPNGYGQFQLTKDGKRVTGTAHRVSWAFAHPDSDPPMVDHICRVRHCVNPDHLRPATAKQNGENTLGANRNSKSGVRGVYWSRVHQRWVAEVMHNRRRVFARTFHTLEEAEAAVIAARNKVFTYNDADRAA